MNLQKLRPQNKIAEVNSRVGNDFIKRQQGTTKMIYDTLFLGGQTSLNFFENTNQRSFPDTNVKNGQLISGDSIAVQRISFAGVIKQNATIVQVLSINELMLLPEYEALKLAEFEIEINTDTVMKPVRMLHVLSPFNKSSMNDDCSVFELNTDLIIPPQLDFKVTVRTPDYTPNNEVQMFLTCTIEGVGAQLNLKTNM